MLGTEFLPFSSPRPNSTDSRDTQTSQRLIGVAYPTRTLPISHVILFRLHGVIHAQLLLL